MKQDPTAADVPPRLRALIRFAVQLTREPSAIGRESIDQLRAAGLSDSAIHDTASIVAYFNFVNRTALGLGVELE